MPLITYVLLEFYYDNSVWKDFMTNLIFVTIFISDDILLIIPCKKEQSIYITITSNTDPIAL